MTSAFLSYIFAATSVLYILHLGFYMIGASVYDVWQRRRLRNYQGRHKKFHTPYRPSITVLIPAHNEEKVIERCLNSVVASSYPHLAIIVINDASTDATKHIIHQYQRTHKDRPLRTINKRRNVGKGAALNDALRRYVKTPLVMMIDADSVIAPVAIERAVSYFTNPSIAGVAANVQIISHHTALGMLQKFEHMISYQSKKAYSITNCDYIIGGVASTYRTRVIRSVGFYDTDTLTEDISLSLKIVNKGNRSHRLVYGADVVAMTEPVETFPALLRQRYRWKYGSLQNVIKHSHLIDSSMPKYTPMLTIYRLPMAIVTEIVLLFLPFTWIYAIYVTLFEHSLLLIVGAYLTITLYTLTTLWYNDYLQRRERMLLSLYVPILYFVYYVMDIIQIIAATQCLVNVRRLSRRESTVSTWASPARIGDRLSPASAIAPLDTIGDPDE